MRNLFRKLVKLTVLSIVAAFMLGALAVTLTAAILG